MLDTQLAYLAGLIDGEGTVALSIRKGRVDFHLKVVVYNTDETVIDWLVLTFGGSKYKVGRPLYPQHSQEYQWYVSTQKAHDILVATLPYLIIKQARARIAIEAWQNRQPTPRAERRRPIPFEVLTKREGYIEAFKQN